MKDGIAAIKVENATESDIIIGVDQVLHRYNMDKCEAFIWKRNEDTDIWLLRAGLGESGGMQKVERPKVLLETSNDVIDDIKEPFSMNGEGHTFFIEFKNGEHKLYMASKKGEYEEKLKIAKDVIEDYLSHPKVNEDNEAAIKLREQLNTMKRFTKSETSERAEERIARIDSNNDYTKTEKTELRNQIYQEYINEAKRTVSLIVRWAKEFGVEDLSPLGIERAKMSTVLGPAFTKTQQQVQQIFNTYKTQLQATFPMGTLFKYRGSLARGIRSPKKLTVTGAIQFWDSTDFDVDVFAEVTAEAWAEIEADVPEAIGLNRINFMDLSRWGKYGAIENLMKTVEQDLHAQTGADIDPNKINLVIQTSEASSKQLRTGVDYPLEAFEKAGYPNYEKSLKIEERTFRDNGEETRGRRRIAPEKHEDLF